MYLQILKAYLNEPFPYPQKKWMLVLIPPLWVFLALFLLEPIGLSKTTNKFFSVMVYTIITIMVCALVVYIFPHIFKNYHNPQKWTRGKFLSIGLTIILILPFPSLIAGNLILSKEGVEIISNPFVRFVSMYMIVFTIGLFPTVFTYLLAASSWFSSQKGKNDIIHKDTRAQTIDMEESGVIEIVGSTKESVTLKPNNILYIEATGNYVTIHFVKNDAVHKKMIRITLLQIIDILSPYSQMVRCHRTFIVNVHHVRNIQGNSKACTLNVFNDDIKVPVARSYIKSIREIFEV